MILLRPGSRVRIQFGLRLRPQNLPAALLLHTDQLSSLVIQMTGTRKREIRFHEDTDLHRNNLPQFSG